MPASSCSRAVTSSESPTLTFEPTTGVSNEMLGAATLTISESVRVLSAASVAVVRMMIRSPFFAPSSGTGTVRVDVSEVGLNVAVSMPMTCDEFRTVVRIEETPLLSDVVMSTVTFAPGTTALFVPPRRTKVIVGRSTSSCAPEDWVGRRVSQLDATMAPKASAASRETDRREIMVAPLCSAGG